MAEQDLAVTCKTRSDALLVLWLATSCHLNGQQMRARKSLACDRAVDIEIPHKFDVVRAILIAASEIQVDSVQPINGPVEYPNPELAREQALEELRNQASAA